MKKVAAASCCAVFGRNGEGKRDERQTESRRKLDLTKEREGRRMDLLTKRKFPSTADGSVSRRMEDKIKRCQKGIELLKKIQGLI